MLFPVGDYFMAPIKPEQFPSKTVMQLQAYSAKFFFFFFLISNENFIKKRKQRTQVHWECTMGAQIKNQNYNDQVKQ